MKKLRYLIVLAAMVSLLMTGCGSSSAPSTSNSNSAPTAPAADSAGEALSPDVIKARGVLVVGGEMNYEPFEFYNDDEEVIGYDIDIWNKVVEDLGVDLKIVDIPFAGVLTGMDAGQYDVAGCAIGVTADRAKSYTFSSPIWATEFSITKMKGNDSIQSIEDIDGKVVGVQTGSTCEIELNTYSDQLKANGGQGITIKGYSGPNDSFLDMNNGGVDAVIESFDMTRAITAQNENFEVVGEIPVRIYVSYAFRNEDAELIDFVNSEIQTLKDSGKLYELQEQWFGFTIEDLPADNFVPEN